jgi:hypothetical protein
MSRFSFSGVPNALNLELNLTRQFEVALVLASRRRPVVLQSKKFPFSAAIGLLCAWACYVVS